jgi:hypothetical protein
MKLQKALNRTVGTTEYFKWYVSIPPDVVARLGWQRGKQISYDIVKGRLILS